MILGLGDLGFGFLAGMFGMGGLMRVACDGVFLAFSAGDMINDSEAWNGRSGFIVYMACLSNCISITSHAWLSVLEMAAAPYAIRRGEEETSRLARDVQ